MGRIDNKFKQRDIFNLEEDIKQIDQQKRPQTAFEPKEQAKPSLQR